MHRAGPPPPRLRALPRWAGVVTGVVAVCALVGGALTVRDLAFGRGGRPAAAGGTRSVGAAPPGSRLLPVASASASRPSPRSSSPRPTRAATRSPDPSAQAAPPAPATSASCAHPVFQTSDPAGGWTSGSYFVYNNMWNVSNYSVQQTLYACSYHDWYVVANMNNDSGDGAVKTYPNVHEDFGERAISSFHSISSTFAEQSPHRGIYEDAYDIWLNGVATSGSTEVMVWTENFGQSPSGSLQASASLGGRTYKVYRSGSYIAFVADTNFTSGTVNLLQVFDWIIGKGWIGPSSTLGQIDYGAELVSTGGSPATFSFTGFSIATS